MVEPVMNLYGVGIKDTGDDRDNGIIPEEASPELMPIPVWLVTRRELHASRSIRLVFGALAGSLGEQRFRPCAVA